MEITKEMVEVTMYGSFYSIPERMWGGIERYINHGSIPGSFLTAVIQNDLYGAVLSADIENVKNLPAYAHFFITKTLFECRGSEEKMCKWIQDCNKLRGDPNANK